MGVHRVSLMLAVLVLLLSGCDGGADTVTAGSRPTSHPSASATPTQPDEASVQQYVGLVSARRTALEHEILRISEPTCLWFEPGRVDPRPGSTVCLDGLAAVGDKASALSATLEAAMDPAAPTYIGAPPVEIRGLTEETIRVADELAATAGGATRACVTRDAPDCKTRLTGSSYWMTTLQKLLSVDWAGLGA